MADPTLRPHRLERPELAPGELRLLELGGREILLCQVDGVYHAVSMACTHLAVSLAGGQLRAHVLECPLHGACFDVRTGRATQGPARDPLDTYTVHVTDSGLEVEIPE